MELLWLGVAWPGLGVILVRIDVISVVKALETGTLWRDIGELACIIELASV